MERITRVEPETTVAWEGGRASGTVKLELPAIPLAPHAAAAAPADPGPPALGPEPPPPAPDPAPTAPGPQAQLGAVHHRPFSRG